jgi:hypothetical protein
MKLGVKRGNYNFGRLSEVAGPNVSTTKIVIEEYLQMEVLSDL